MSIHNGLNNTQEIPSVFPNSSSESISPSQVTPLKSTEPSIHNTDPEIPLNPAGTRPSIPPREPIHRASMQSGASNGQNAMPYRRPPRQSAKKPKRNGNSESEPKKKKRKKRKRSSCIARLIASFLTLCLVIFVIYSAVAISVIKKLQYQETGIRHMEENSLAQADDQVRNILLIGTDSRSTEKGHVESIHIFSISKHNKTVTLSSLLKDCYVNIPTVGADRLSEAYSYGGPTLLMDTITNEFGIPVDEYICIGFSAYINLVNSLGGLEMNVSDETMKAINQSLKNEINMKLRQDDQMDLLNSAGKVVLNGKQLLAYSRMNGAEGFDRLNVQDLIVSGIVEKLKSADFSTLSNIAKEAFPVIWTNMKTSTLYALTLTLPIHLLRYDYQSLQLPVKGTYHNYQDDNGNKCFTVDYDANLKQFLSALQNTNKQ